MLGWLARRAVIDVIALAIAGAVRGLPDKQEREAAQGGALPMQDTPTPTAPQQETP